MTTVEQMEFLMEMAKTGEEFEIYDEGGVLKYAPYKFEGGNIIDYEGDRWDMIRVYEFKRLPYKPKDGRPYWTIEPQSPELVQEYAWCGSVREHCLIERRLVFRTEEEAEAKAREWGLIE